MLRACERQHWLTPDVFWGLPRHEQALLIVYTQERDIEESERAGSLALGRALTEKE